MTSNMSLYLNCIYGGESYCVCLYVMCVCVHLYLHEYVCVQFFFPQIRTSDHYCISCKRIILSVIK